jgi:hypothetical protein
MAAELISPMAWPRVATGVRWMNVGGATTMYAAAAPESPNRTHEGTRFGCHTQISSGRLFADFQ